MSHSATDAPRAWDFGMVDSDWLAFPMCVAAAEQDWSNGRLGPESSYWHERNWVRWEANPDRSRSRCLAFQHVDVQVVARMASSQRREHMLLGNVGVALRGRD